MKIDLNVAEIFILYKNGILESYDINSSYKISDFKLSNANAGHITAFEVINDGLNLVIGTNVGYLHPLHRNG